MTIDDSLVLEEQRLKIQIETIEACQTAVFEVIRQYEDSACKLMQEEIVLAIHAIGLDLQTELLHVRFAQARQH
ncbi:hypothetical protein PC41400_09115 [Paenibacillus chitinolyticus]|uniref:Uncharacterized protein n=1 Tax=Paenibacillus chitinolyticus TaxID=79263 RepID=A0A410WTY0_9BACL|nr:hypothetical protein [Paenibacillus chitinolyticus]MCY9593217.1 hypothetical protein [Paenibacillus chitinolyticus]MCY9594944.1 hypothetical protein [Paenibacillus chitinolyticus]MEC0248170.1 hypothetical protein [Paenibacillus chitinolyticus]QAV17813.1 hypothetical protein PC41400_09115 [Paenibacillus chitinolyticus]